MYNLHNKNNKKFKQFVKKKIVGIRHQTLFTKAMDIEVAVVYQVECWLIRRKARVRAPGQTSKRNTKSISAAISSKQISGKNSESK